MATNNQNQKSEEPEPFLMPSPKQEKDVITIMGVQGLSHNDFFYPRTENYAAVNQDIPEID